MQGIIFAERTKAIQKQLTEDLEHTAYGAVELERELRKDWKYAGRYYAGSVYQWPWRGAVE